MTTNIARWRTAIRTIRIFITGTGIERRRREGKSSDDGWRNTDGFADPWWRYPPLRNVLISGLIAGTGFALAHLGFISKRIVMLPLALGGFRGLVSGAMLLVASVLADWPWTALGPAMTFIGGALFSVAAMAGLLMRRTAQAR